jgi:hypothetical protein
MVFFFSFYFLKTGFTTSELGELTAASFLKLTLSAVKILQHMFCNFFDEPDLILLSDNNLELNLAR